MAPKQSGGRKQRKPESASEAAGREELPGDGGSEAAVAAAREVVEESPAKTMVSRLWSDPKVLHSIGHLCSSYIV